MKTKRMRTIRAFEFLSRMVLFRLGTAWEVETLREFERLVLLIDVSVSSLLFRSIFVWNSRGMPFFNQINWNLHERMRVLLVKYEKKMNSRNGRWVLCVCIYIYVRVWQWKHHPTTYTFRKDDRFQNQYAEEIFDLKWNRNLIRWWCWVSSDIECKRSACVLFIRLSLEMMTIGGWFIRRLAKV